MKKLTYFLATLLALFFAAPTFATPGPSGYFINLDLIKQIVCKSDANPEMGWSGTAFYIGETTLMTAGHVIIGPEGAGKSTCYINDKPISVKTLDSGLDYAIITSEDHSSEYLTFDCQPYQKNEQYYAVGYALGVNFVFQPLIGTSSIEGNDSPGFIGETRLVGKIYAGMSGGPIFNSRGVVTGIVNGDDAEGRAVAVSRSLRETELCR